MTRPGSRKLAYADTTPAHKYGPTPIYGQCEADSCTRPARTTCAECSGDYCLTHEGHETHAGSHERGHNDVPG